jgi:mRNA interferase MazF
MNGREAPKIRRGDVFWMESDERASVRHPHVVVQDDVFNRSRINTVVVCALTSNLNRASEPGNVRLEAGEGGLTKPSVVLVSQVASVERGSLGEQLGTLSQERVDQVIAGLRFQQAAFFRDE